MAIEIDKLLSEVRALPREEQVRVRRLLDDEIGSSGSVAQAAEEEFKRRLASLGFLRQLRPPVGDLGPYRDRTPFEIEGRPLSETLIEERR